MLPYPRLIVSAFCAVMLWQTAIPAQVISPQDQQRREESQHQAQLDQMRQIERQGNRDLHREQEQQQAQALAQQQYTIQQQAQEQQAQEQQAQEQQAAHQRDQHHVDEQTQAEQRAAIPPVPEVPAPRQQAAEANVPHWSYRNFSGPDKAGVGALCIVLVALAFAAGILPLRRHHH